MLASKLYGQSFRFLWGDYLKYSGDETGIFPGYYSAVPIWDAQFSLKSYQNTPHSSPIMTRYGVLIVCPNSDSYLASVTAAMYAISYYIALRYNGTQLYIITMTAGTLVPCGTMPQ